MQIGIVKQRINSILLFCINAFSTRSSDMPLVHTKKTAFNIRLIHAFQSHTSCWDRAASSNSLCHLPAYHSLPAPRARRSGSLPFSKRWRGSGSSSMQVLNRFSRPVSGVHELRWRETHGYRDWNVHQLGRASPGLGPLEPPSPGIDPLPPPLVITLAGNLFRPIVNH